MKIFRLKNAAFCTVVMWVVIIGAFFVPAIFVMCLNFVSENVKIIVFLAAITGLTVYLIKNFVLLMAMDTSLMLLQCHNTARKRFVLQDDFLVERSEKRISRFGKSCAPTNIIPQPKQLRYKSCAPVTVYSSGIEKVIATYYTEILDKNEYQLILKSANANSNHLTAKAKHRFLDKAQKSSPLNRVTVIVIYAKCIEPTFKIRLYDTVCKNVGDGLDTAVIACVVDLQERTCTFDSMRDPYIFQYPAKNRAIRIVKKYIFNNKLPLAQSPDLLDLTPELDPEQSLWSLWRKLKKELIDDEKQTKKRFKKMSHKQIILEDDFIYLKWNDSGAWLYCELDVEKKTAKIDEIDCWYYPKSNKIPKATALEIKSVIATYFAELGYSKMEISYE